MCGMYRIEWKQASGNWAQHSGGWTLNEAMQLVWKSGLTHRICFRVVAERRGN